MKSEHTSGAGDETNPADGTGASDERSAALEIAADRRTALKGLGAAGICLGLGALATGTAAANQPADDDRRAGEAADRRRDLSRRRAEGVGEEVAAGAGRPHTPIAAGPVKRTRQSPFEEMVQAGREPCPTAFAHRLVGRMSRNQADGSADALDTE